MASQFGCGDLAPDEELACMRTVDASVIEEFLHNYIDNGTEPAVSFAPIVDEKTVFSDFYARAVNGSVAALVSGRKPFHFNPRLLTIPADDSGVQLG